MISARFTTIAQLAERRAEWQRLVETSLDPNPFYGPDYLITSEKALHPQNPIRLLIVERDGALIALFPLEKPVLRDFLFGRAWRMYRNDYTCLGTPLIAQDHAPEALDCALAFLRKAPGPKRLILPQLPAEGAFAALLHASGKRLGLACSLVSNHARAAISTKLGAEDYARSHWSGKRRKALAKARRNLAERGELVCRSIPGNAADFTIALDAFLALEASGWKGKTGTALAADAASLRFARSAYSPANAWIESLENAGEPIAMALFVHAQGTAFNVKVAYDERLAKESPGVLLDADLVHLAAAGGPFRMVDSCALPGHPCEALWHERISIDEVVLGLVASRASFGTRLLGGWMRLVARLKALRHAKAYSSKPAT